MERSFHTYQFLDGTTPFLSAFCDLFRFCSETSWSQILTKEARYSCRALSETILGYVRMAVDHLVSRLTIEGTVADYYEEH